MKTLAILGAGTAGTMMANHLRRELPTRDAPNGWRIVVIDERTQHYYQPGFLFVPFDIYTPEETVKPIGDFLPAGVDLLTRRAEHIDTAHSQVVFDDETSLTYDVLIIATGCKIAPEETPGMLGDEWRKSIFDFYTYDGAIALRDRLRSWEGGRLVVHITEMPIKCPVAPLEFAFLADSYFKHRQMRDRVDLVFVTPLSGAFTKPKASATLDHLLMEKQIRIESDFAVERIDNERRVLIDYGGREVPFDLLVTIPVNKGDALIERSGIGDDLNYVPTHRATLQSVQAPNVFVIGDATNVPASKAGSVAHFEAEVLTANVLHFVHGRPLQEEFDGHANCFVETGDGKAILIDFNYTHEPVEGTFPFPGVGPLRLLSESRTNHMGKMAFRWIYWNMLLKGHHLPFVSTHMQETGKHFS
ncbi:MAG: NAD(P)/FAD-dependent oxidoreductase [Gemmatimonadaceae bacterium]|nr:NAD(P)/FAD-dependent oxidoreductase [Gemmatimonadaceae bacterium]